MSFSFLNDTIFSQSTLIILLAFTLIPLLIGSFASQHSIATINDFFIYNRKMGTIISFFTVYATWWSSFAFLGSISYFYKFGPIYWTGIVWNILFGILYMVYGTKVSLYCKKLSYITPIDFYSDIYNSKILNFIVMAMMVVFTTLYLQIQLFGGAILISIASGNIIPWQICALVFFIVMIIYLWSGGMRAVAWADVFYGILIFFGMLFAGFYLAYKFGGVDSIFRKILIESPEMLVIAPAGNVSGITMWISMFIIIPIGTLMGPPMWLRMNATMENKTFSIMPLLISVAAIAYLGSMLVGNIAILFPPEGVSTADYILPNLLRDNSPAWVAALIMCCGAAACLSTANAEVHAISSLVTLNIYKTYINPRATEKRTVFVGKTVIVLFSCIAYITLISSNYIASIVETGVFSLACMAQLIVPLTGALLWRRSNSTGALLGIVVGMALTFSLSFIPNVVLYIHPGIIGLFANIIVFLLFGIILPENTESSKKITSYRNSIFKPNNSLNEKEERN